MKAEAKSAEVIYIYPKRSSFIDRDIDLLAAIRRLHHHGLLRGPKWLLPWRLLVQGAFLLRHAGWNKDVICHFAGYHSIIPAILARKCYIILAGSDASSFPNIDYGNFRKPLYAWATRFSIRRATRLLPVHASLIETEQNYDPSAPALQGVKAFVPALRTPWTAIPYGFDAHYWHPEPNLRRDRDLIICIASGTVPGSHTHFRKGIDLVISSAPAFPELRFRIIGSPDPSQYRDLPSNIEVLGAMAAEELRRNFSQAGFYLQVSIMEGFPNALCEAMLCGCVPVVSNVAAMPYIVGSTGYVVNKRDTLSLKSILRNALSDPTWPERSAAARQRIRGNFTLEQRLNALTAILRENGSERPGRE